MWLGNSYCSTAWWWYRKVIYSPGAFFVFVFVTPVPRSLQLYWRGYLEDSRSFNGDPPHLTLNHGFPVRRLHRQMPLAHFSKIGGYGNRTPDLLHWRPEYAPLHHQPLMMIQTARIQLRWYQLQQIYLNDFLQILSVLTPDTWSFLKKMKTMRLAADLNFNGIDSCILVSVFV